MQMSYAKMRDVDRDDLRVFLALIEEGGSVGRLA
jgi:hypothetical protein